MDQKDFKNIGDEIKEIVKNAIDSEDFSNLSCTIKSGLEKATDALGYGIKTAEKTVAETIDSYQSKKYKQEVVLYRKMNGLKIGTMIAIICGYFFGGSIGIFLLSFILLMVAMGSVSFGFLLPIIILIPLFVVCMTIGIRGSMKLSMIRRFEKYQQCLQEKTYGNLSDIASIIGKTEAYIRNDIRKMIEKGWFLQGHLDDEQHYLILSDATYQDYLQLKKQSARKKKEQEKCSQRKMSLEAMKLVEEGRKFVDVIHECNTVISDETISDKITFIEELIDNIFDYIERYPIHTEKIKKLMDYYLPTTVKLLKAYEELDKQSVQGENIASAKKEIQESLDILCTAYKRKLDDLFLEQTWDVSSDISVLKSMLAQDGLLENDF